MEAFIQFFSTKNEKILSIYSTKHAPRKILGANAYNGGLI